MNYRIEFLTDVKKDIKGISREDIKKILIAIRTKLSSDPTHYGKALKKRLKGLWSLRVGDFRIIYRIQEEKVLVIVIKIGHRKNVYREIFSRKMKLNSKGL